MRTAAVTEMAWEPYPGQRGKGIELKHYFEGKPGSPDNYEMRLIRYTEESDYFAPRHHHNFDQFRWPTIGPLNWAPKQFIGVDQLGYFPEGAYYGPQESEPGFEFMIVQFAGANGDGYMGADETDQGVAALTERGSFERGVYRGVDDNGRPYNQDAYEAVWEQVNGRKIEYRPGRYQAPIVIDPEAFAWTEHDTPGVAAKPLGVFTERNIRAGLLRVEPGAETQVEAGSQVLLGWVVSGDVAVNGAAIGPQGGYELQPGELATLTGREPAVVLQMTMPDFSS